MKMSHKTIEFLGYSVFCDDLNSINLDNSRSIVINTINPHSYCVAKKDNTFNNALLSSDILLPDGIGIVKAVKLINNINISRIAGYDLLIYLLEYLNKTKGKCFFMGSTETVLKTIKNRINEEYPAIKVGLYAPPFKEKFNESDNKVIIDSINKFNPDILFVGMTAPKQEKWVYHNNNKLNTNAICAIGAAFDFYAETINRPSLFWRNMGFEWLARFFKNPLKLWKRNLISMPIFIFDVIKNKLGKD